MSPGVTVLTLQRLKKMIIDILMLTEVHVLDLTVIKGKEAERVDIFKYLVTVLVDDK